MCLPSLRRCYGGEVSHHLLQGLRKELNAVGSVVCAAMGNCGRVWHCSDCSDYHTIDQYSILQSSQDRCACMKVMADFNSCWDVILEK